MGDVLTEFIEPTELTGLIRGALWEMEENRFTLSQDLPNEYHEGIDYTYLRGQQRLTEAGVFRAWDSESPLVRREGLSREFGEIVPISAKTTFGERERLRLRQLSGREDVISFIRRDVALLARTIGARLELARADALWNGKVTVNENKLQFVVDFGRDAAANRTLSQLAAAHGTVTWTDHDNSTPIDDLLALVEEYEIVNATLPAKIKMSRWLYQHMLRSAQLQKQAFPLVAANERPRLSDDQAAAQLTGFGLPPIELYDAKVDVSNSSGVRETRRVSPANKLLLLPGSVDEGYDLGATYLGQTAEAQELPEYTGFGGTDADGTGGLGVVAGMWHSKDPVRIWMHAAAVAFPVLRDPNLSFAAEVATV